MNPIAVYFAFNAVAAVFFTIGLAVGRTALGREIQLPSLPDERTSRQWTTSAVDGQPAEIVLRLSEPGWLLIRAVCIPVGNVRLALYMDERLLDVHTFPLGTPEANVAFRCDAAAGCHRVRFESQGDARAKVMTVMADPQVVDNPVNI